MIRAIAAIDRQYGLATDKGIPWNLPTDRRYFRTKTKNSLMLMGRGMYIELSAPLPERVNYVALSRPEKLREGFITVTEVEKFLRDNQHQNTWVVGGAGLFATTMQFINELYLTRIDGEFHCTKFFPPFEKDFVLRSQSAPYFENNISFRFEVWQRPALT